MSRNADAAADALSLAARIIAYTTGEERDCAVASLREYMATFTGPAFERLADSDRMRYSERDIVAVTMLGVDIPARVSLWLLSREGQAETTALLGDIPDTSIWDDEADLSPAGSAQTLWHLLSSRHGMGRTKTSKLMTVKRPDLVPIYDTYVGRALGLADVNDWLCWQDMLRGRPDVISAAKELAIEAGATSLSVLRTLDVVVWMREHGYQWASAGSLPYYDGSVTPQRVKWVEPPSWPAGPECPMSA